jgi:LacI family transcriptional regulator
MSLLLYSNVMPKRTTMTDIARAVGLSKNTVSLALRNDPQIPDRTKQKIREAANRLGYRRNPVVAHLMAELRSHTEGSPRSTLALINANEAPDAFTKHPTIPTYVEGCQKRANRLGYGLDTFWIHDPAMTEKRLLQVLKTRGVRGVVLIGLMAQNRLPRRFAKLWQNYPCVVTGVRTRDPALPFACTDHHIVALRAFQKSIELGYRRPALVLDEVIDKLVEGRFSAGFRTGQQVLPATRRIPPFLSVRTARKDRALFQAWRERYQPDVILTLYNEVRDWLSELGYRVPENLGLIQLEWRKDRPEWAGINQHNEAVGEAAIDMLVSMIQGGETSPPPSPRATLIGGSWVDGQTVSALPEDKKTLTIPG